MFRVIELTFSKYVELQLQKEGDPGVWETIWSGRGLTRDEAIEKLKEHRQRLAPVQLFAGTKDELIAAIDAL